MVIGMAIGGTLAAGVAVLNKASFVLATRQSEPEASATGLSANTNAALFSMIFNAWC